MKVVVLLSRRDDSYSSVMASFVHTTLLCRRIHRVVSESPAAPFCPPKVYLSLVREVTLRSEISKIKKKKQCLWRTN